MKYFIAAAQKRLNILFKRLFDLQGMNPHAGSKRISHYFRQPRVIS